MFEVCRAVPTTVKIILLGKGSLPSDFNFFSKKDNINSIIQFLNVTASFVVQAEITVNFFTNSVLEKASAEWTFIINSEKLDRE